MTDREFLDALESGELPEHEFGHAAHVRAAYLYLKEGEFIDAYARIRRAIRNFADRLGKPDKYHETITVAYLALIQQRMREGGAAADWAAFVQANPELFAPDLLRRYYPQDQLASEMARAIFLLPAVSPIVTPCDRSLK